MRAVARLLTEAHALGMLRGLAADALALALVFAALAGAWIVTPSNLAASDAGPSASAQHLRCVEAAAGKGCGR